MKSRSLLCLVILTLSGCRPFASAGAHRTLASLPAGCTSPGTVQMLSFPVRGGYDYQYGLYLPPCYEAQADIVYPVIYFVPGRTSGPGTWFSAGLAPIADELIQTGELPPFIIVTTQNIDSNDELDAHTIVNELIPFVESRYPISPERRYHSVAGGSLGGIAAYRIGLGNPGHFASIGMFGSGAIHGEEPRIRSWLQATNSRNRPRVFFNTGFQDPLMLDQARVMMGLLDEFGVTHTHIFTAGAHNYAYWATNLPAFLHWVALDW